MEVFFVEIIQKRGRTSFKKIKRDARADVKQGTKTNKRGVGVLQFFKKEIKMADIQSKRFSFLISFLFSFLLGVWYLRSWHYLFLTVSMTINVFLYLKTNSSLSSFTMNLVAKLVVHNFRSISTNYQQ